MYKTRKGFIRAGITPTTRTLTNPRNSKKAVSMSDIFISYKRKLPRENLRMRSKKNAGVSGGTLSYEEVNISMT